MLQQLKKKIPLIAGGSVSSFGFFSEADNPSF